MAALDAVVASADTEASDPAAFVAEVAAAAAEALASFALVVAVWALVATCEAVSYTHLTLPTIYSV